MDCTKHEAVLTEISQMKGDILQLKNDIRDLYHITNTYGSSQARIETILDNVVSGLGGVAKKLDDGMESLNKKITELSMLPAKRWNALVTAGITAIIVGIVGFAIGKFLK